MINKWLLFFIIPHISILAKETINGFEADYFLEDKNFYSAYDSKTKYRYYVGQLQKTYELPIAEVYKSLMSFEHKCNDKYKIKRQYRSRDYDCIFHNSNIVENHIFINDKIKQAKKSDEKERFVLKRFIYNNSRYFQYDWVISKQDEQNGKKRYLIYNTLMPPEDIEKYIDNPRSPDIVFDQVEAFFELIEIKENTTLLTYRYTSRTNHWLLNSKIAAGQVLGNFQSNFQGLFENFEERTKKVIKAQKPLNVKY